MLDYSLAREIFTPNVSELYIKEVSENESQNRCFISARFKLFRKTLMHLFVSVNRSQTRKEPLQQSFFI